MNEQQGVRPTERMTYRDSTYSIVSKVAYLIDQAVILLAVALAHLVQDSGQLLQAGEP